VFYRYKSNTTGMITKTDSLNTANATGAMVTGNPHLSERANDSGKAGNNDIMELLKMVDDCIYERRIGSIR